MVFARRQSRHHRQAQTAADRLTAQRYISENSGTGAKMPYGWFGWTKKGVIQSIFCVFFLHQEDMGILVADFGGPSPNRHRLFCFLRFSLHKTCV